MYDETLDGGAVRDGKADLREELQACVREPISKVTRATFADDCAAWRDAIIRYQRCDPAVVPAVTSQTRCVDDDDLPERRTVRDCAELLWDRVSALCEVPTGAMRSHCLEEVIAD